MILNAITQATLEDPRVQSSNFLKELCTATMALYTSSPPELPWIGYFAEESGAFIGACAYKSVPSEGEVEIAYFTFPDHEGRGVATNMAQQLIDLAFEHGVTRVKAQTLPRPNASTRILEKLGFVFAGSVNHPEDGEVWEWHKQRD